MRQILRRSFEIKSVKGLMCMKIKFVTLVVSLALVLATFCCSAAPGRYDEIPKADIAIGGITLGTDESYVRKVYGNPDKITHTDDRRRAGPIKTKTFTYGTTFIIVFNEENNKVWEVKSTGNNGLKTPSGFTVGMKLADVYNHYGPGYDGDNSLGYSSNWWMRIKFKGDKSGKITEIHIYAIP